MNPNHQQATVATNPDVGNGSGGGESSTDYRAMKPPAPAPTSRIQTAAAATTQQRQQQQPQPQPIPLPRHFLVRPGTVKHTASGAVTIPGPMVPLLPVDQLPEWMDVLGVPRELAVEQTAGLVNLGTVARGPAPFFYEVYFHQPQHDQQQYVQCPRRGNGDDSSKKKHWSEAEQEDEDGRGNGNGRPMTEDASSSSRTSISASSSLASASRMDPAAKSFTSARATSASNEKSRASKTNDPSAKHGTNNRGDPPPPRLPSPTVHGSSTSASNQYLYYHNNNHNDDDGGGGHPLPPPSPPHPYSADRMLAASAAASFHAPSHPHDPAHHQHSNHNRLLSSSAASKRHGSNPSPASVYCRHWCHHGRCRWQGACRYAHAMPSTAEGLRAVGLGDYPAWWRAAVGMAFRMTGGGGGGYLPSPRPSAGPYPHPHHFAGGGGGGGPGFPSPAGGSSKRKIREWREMTMTMGWNPSAVGPFANAAGGGSSDARDGAVRSHKEHERDRGEGGNEHGRKAKGVEKSRSAVVANSGNSGCTESQRRAAVDYLGMDEEELVAETVEGIEAPPKDGRQTAVGETNALVEI
ncbi:hypothetical protein DL769_002033 [Monosporascus sp. CRB-8-3]|nr:hypothetical protein DL769_002033 [Monosporascus sp. CRB-8-3]